MTEETMYKLGTISLYGETKGCDPQVVHSGWRGMRLGPGDRGPDMTIN